MPTIDTNSAAAAVKAAEAAASSADASPMSIESTESEAKSEAPVKTEEADVKFELPNTSEVIDKINESSTLICAVESVAAMYRIPSQNIVGDPTADRITVSEGNIVVPTNVPGAPANHGKAIIQSIGAVLDYISQRADDKLNQFQADNIRNGINKEKIADTIDPSKGPVASTHVDANDDPVIIYRSGEVGMSNTKEAQNKVDELMNLGAVPQKTENGAYSYFSDEDNNLFADNNGNDYKISDTMGSGPETDVNVGSGDIPDTSSGLDETNVSTSINESALLLDVLSNYNNTRHLGYDIMMEQGFDFVKPVEFFTESAKKKKNKEIVASDIKHMKFDNTKLLKAIKYMNEARKAQSNNKKVNIPELIANPSYQKAIDCLNDQFNMRLNVRFIKDKSEASNVGTPIFNDIKNNLVISKSKGFQLGNLPIDIFVINSGIDEDVPDDMSLFGQHIIAVFCHEIFHNIMAVLKSKEAQFTASLIETITIAKDIPSASNRRKLITNFVNTLEEFNGVKLNVLSRRSLVKHLTYVTTICHDEQALKEYEAAIKNKGAGGIDEQIKKMEKKVRKLKIHTYGPGRYIGTALMTIFSFIVASHAYGAYLVFWAIMGSLNALELIGTGINQAIEISDIKKFKEGKTRNYEEHWCDMFAASYGLPVTFFMVGSPRKGVANDYALETLKRYDELQREAYQLMLIKYPTVSERNQASVKYAKKVLDSKAKIDPAIRKYLEWIVSNYSKTLDMDIDEIYSKGTFDPKTAEDLDKHIQNLIGSANISIKESDLSWLDDLVDDTEYLY